jgi:hypothetical protein
MEDTQITQSRLKTLKNGAVYSLDEKRIVKAPVMSSEAASALARRRWEKVRRKAAQRILGEAKSIDVEVRTPADALALLYAKQYTTIMDSDKPVIEQVEKLTRIVTGNDASQSQRANVSAPPGSIVADPDALHRLLELIEQDKQAAVERARAIDAGA